MSKWKLFTGKKQDLQSINQTNHHERFNPKRISPDQEGSIQFHNITLDRDRLRQSRLSQEKDKTIGRSLIGKALIFQQPRVMNTSFSEMKLTQNQRRPRKSLLSSASFILNIPEEYDSRTKKSQHSGSKSDKDPSILMQKIQEIKKQFENFQLVIFNELKRQEKFINSMIEQIVTQVQQQEKAQKKLNQSNFYLRNSQIQYMGKVMQKNSTEGEEQIREDEAKEKIRNFITSRKKPDLKIEIHEPQHGQLIGSTCQNAEKLNSPSLSRLINAMQSLKKDVKDLNQISDISTLGSPKNVRSKFDWNCSLRINR